MIAAASHRLRLRTLHQGFEFGLKRVKRLNNSIIAAYPVH